MIALAAKEVMEVFDGRVRRVRGLSLSGISAVDWAASASTGERASDTGRAYVVLIPTRRPNPNADIRVLD